MNSNGVLLWSTLIGDGNTVSSLTIDNNENLYCFGTLGFSSSYFSPLQKLGYYYDDIAGNPAKTYLATFSSSYLNTWFTAFGGIGFGEFSGKSKFDNNKANLYICGQTTASENASEAYPVVFTQPQYYQSYGDRFDAFIAKFSIPSSPTSIEDLSVQKNELVIFPNPNNSVFYVNIKDDFENAKIEITDYLGKKVYTGVLENSSTKIETDHLPCGIYILEIVNNDIRYYGKFIVAK